MTTGFHRSAPRLPTVVTSDSMTCVSRNGRLNDHARMDAGNCRDAGRCGSCTPRLSSLGRLSTPKALGRLKAMTEGSAESVTPEQVEEAGDVLSA